ncbi:endonuclease/exonuclease/phosphatase family protein [Pseudomonas sp. NCHU5208]|uniref:endonuclease/exonuclease/phosphatase family protein n=1 Tax=unclassified Pseudomonas TaxID=196821 RepID=UPI003F9C6C0A
MATVKILMWNTQHLNHQNQRKPMSEAYEEKLDALLSTLEKLKPEIIALFEVGTTGNPNLKLVDDLKGSYAMKASLSMEGGIRKGTTLGSMVFVRNDIADDYSEPFELPLGSESIRATLLLSDKEENLFAFCHANASYKAAAQVLEDIQLLGSYQGKGIKKLVFFGGDLNTDANSAPASITLPGKDKVLRCLPGTAGFTHISIRSSLALARALYAQEKKNSQGRMLLSESEYINCVMGCDVAYGDIAVPSLLDYAYIHESCDWQSICHASISVTTLSNDSTTLNASSLIDPEKVYATIQRIYMGKVLRSDHFPVVYRISY